MLGLPLERVFAEDSPYWFVGFQCLANPKLLFDQTPGGVVLDSVRRKDKQTVTPTIRSRHDTRPRFEYFSPGSATLRTVYVEKMPFIIGRGEATELQVASTSVSREHAKLVPLGAGYRLVDLESTNGTSVNGQSITDAPLADGDSVSIADVELTFCCSSVGRLQRIVTQPLGDRGRAVRIDPIPNATLNHRALTEALLWQTIPLRETRVFDRLTNQELARVTSIDNPLARQLAASANWDRNSVEARLQRLAWRLMAERAAGPASSTLLLKVESPDFCGEHLYEAFGDAKHSLTSSISLGVALPWSEPENAQGAPDDKLRLRSLGAQLMIDGFRGGGREIEDFAEKAPDFLMLAPEIVVDCATQVERRRQLENLHASCQSAGVCAVLPAKVSPEDLEACADFGLTAMLDNPTTATTAEHSPAFAQA